jgi:glycine cleavage system H protein
MNIPGELKYSQNDEWIRVRDKIGSIGISDYAQEQLSDIVYVEIIAEVGSEIQKGEICATIESVKAAADVYAPVTGKVIAINEELPDTPEMLNTDPYGSAWMIKLEISDPSELDTLMDAKQYQAKLQEKE